MASIANDKAMIYELMEGEKDLHTLTAKLVFPQIPKDMSASEVKVKFNEERGEAKRYEFCFNYGGTASTIMRNFGLTRARAQEIEDNYMKGFNGLKRYQDFRRKDVLRKGYILINKITGHKAFIYDWDKLCKISKELNSDEYRYYKGKRNNPFSEEEKEFRRRISDSQKQSINYPIQGTGALCTKLAMIKFFNYLKKNNLLFKVKFCIIVHDEADIEAPEDIAEDVGKVLIKCMEAGGKPFCTRAKLTADLNIGDYWIH